MKLLSICYPSRALINVLNATKHKCLLTVPNDRTDTYEGHINFWSEESLGSFLLEFEKDWQTSIYHIADRLGAILARRGVHSVHEKI